MTNLQNQPTDLAKRIEELSSKEEIRDCSYRVVRGVDRFDLPLLRSCFHPDAQVQWSTPEPLALADWLKKAEQIPNLTKNAQHILSNVLIDLRGDKANVESYEIARHLTRLGNDWKDIVVSARYLDKFSRRDGVWKIDLRIKVFDWGRIMEGSDPLFDTFALKGRQDREDPSYHLFGVDAFT